MQHTTCTSCLRHLDYWPLRCPGCNGTLLIVEHGACQFAPRVEREKTPENTPLVKVRMSRAELEVRAAQRARDERVHIFAVPGRQGVYTTCSKSEPGKKYNLVAKDGIIACACKGYEYRKSCKHVSALENRLAREAVAARRLTQRIDTAA